MKLNLLPTYVSKEKQSTNAIIGAIGLVVIGLIVTAVMMTYSSGVLASAKQHESDARTRAEQADTESKKADAIMASDVASAVVRNLNLARAMEAHSSVYPDLFDKVRGYIPPYFRLTTMSAAPAGDTTCIVTLTGVVSTYQQYADLMLALLRIPGSSSVSRSGYQLDAAYVPGLTPEDQTGRAIKPGQQNVPDDPIAKLQYLEAQGSYSGYLGVSNFGGDGDLTRGPMPGTSLITVQVTMPGQLMAPDPRATLSSSGAGGGSTALAGGAASGFGAPGAGAGKAAATPPPSQAPDASAGTGKGGKKGKSGDEE
jgi:hypothetical protein